MKHSFLLVLLLTGSLAFAQRPDLMTLTGASGERLKVRTINRTQANDKYSGMMETVI